MAGLGFHFFRLLTCSPVHLLRAPLRGALVPPARFERTANGLGNRCSIQLSYGGDFFAPRKNREAGEQANR
jgi:hypothetical protein